jgi:diaminohydroxyphosphoribosylaminopyrimidine deaminase/5-amino-6-(5-phosphoribosylamino)uracil reductase
MSDDDQRHMRRALELARRGLGAVEPNPPVGAVLTAGGEEIACGWHHRFGGPHAEIEALRAAEQAGRDPRGATLYVTLEPCSHHGKTPPCTEAIVSAGVARVVAAMADPDPNVSGRGLDALRAAGVTVTVGVCREEAEELLAAYVKTRTLHRPWVICKWAQTTDGYLAVPDGRWVSGAASRAEAHRLRGLCDGVLVGVGTVLADDPLLTNRSGRGRRPARVVLDAELRTPLESQLVQTAGETPVIVAATRRGLEQQEAAARALREHGVQVLPLSGEGTVELEPLLDELGLRRWTRLLVEGGAKVLESFLSQALADEVLAFVAPRELGEEGKGLPKLDVADTRTRFDLEACGREAFGKDTLLRFRPAGEQTG